MIVKIIILLLVYFIETQAIQILIYNNAVFYPNYNRSDINSNYTTSSQDECICQCYSISSCLTAMFIGNSQTYTLYSVHISEGTIRISLNMNASVISFTDVKNPPDTIKWLFDGNFNDVYGRYSGYLEGNNSALWISPDYNGIGQAVYLPSRNYSSIHQYLDLTNSSFTFSAWIWIPSNGATSHNGYFILICQCESGNAYKCLQIGIVDGKLFLGFYNDDLRGNSQLELDRWHHVAYVYKRDSSNRSVYLNGYVDKTDRPSNMYKGNTSFITLGAVPLFTSPTFRSGYVDKLIFVSRVKNESEILDEATLVAYYSFDNTYLDSGPNQINNSTGINTSFNSTGRVNQALIIAGSTGSSAYFQANGFYFLGQSNKAFSFSLWIYPYTNYGTIVQVLVSNNQYVPIIGFSTIGSLTIQIINGNIACSISFISGTILLHTWTHIGMVYSSTNGIRLFVNGSLVSQASSCTNYQGYGNYTTITVGYYQQSLQNILTTGAIVAAEYRGEVDELKIFSRALTTTEIYRLSLL